MASKREQDVISPAPTQAWLPNLIACLVNVDIMVIELTAGRLTARHLGSSLYTWTSVIGVVLAGLAMGNYLGGRTVSRIAP